jgi:large subunit ribosomal protein L15
MGTELHNLKAPEGARKKKKRIGRGPGSGNGKTAGRGSKGQKKRSTVRVGFEGGQNPIHRRVPKRGFVNINRVEVHGVNVARLSEAFDAGSEVTVEEILARGLVPKKAKVIKVLGDGNLDKKLSIKVHRVSEKAREKVEAAGGSIELIDSKTAGGDA